MSPKVSVIIPLYNATSFIQETVTSVLNQTYSNIELIIIDDYSTDGSYEKALELQAHNVIVRQNKGKGACAARNYGFELSDGDYIQYLDADDLLSSNKIENQVKLLTHCPNHVAVCSTSHFYDFKENGKITDREYLYTTDKPWKFLLNLWGANGNPNMVQTSAWLTPRNIIQKAGAWDENLSKDQDGEFFCRVLMQSQGIVFDEVSVNYYRKHIGGTNIASGKQEKHLLSQFKALLSKERQLEKFKDIMGFKKAMALQYKFLAIEAWPEFKTISREALFISKNYGGSVFVPVLGGRIIEIIKVIFGWKAARSLSFWIHNSKIITHLRK